MVTSDHHEAFEPTARPRGRRDIGRRTVHDVVSRAVTFGAAIIGSRQETDEARERIQSESVETIYRNVSFGVVAAAFASILLAFSLLRLSDTTTVRGLVFAAYISGCAILHVGLVWLFKRAPDRQARWRYWGRLFALLTLCEGIGWGWAPVGLIPEHMFEASMMCLLVTNGVAAGAIPAFGPYFPAFLSFFLPATLPYFVATFGSKQPIEQAANPLMLLYIVGIGSFGIALNRVFRNQIALRMRAESLAVELQTQIAKVEAANRAKSTFLAAASHDLRQPVHALSLFAGALRGMSMSREASEILHHIDRSTQALDTLFAAILDISKLDAGVVPVNKAAFLITPMLLRLVRDSQDHPGEKRLDVKLRVAEPGCAVYSDPVLLERIVRNIITNAVRYTEQGRVLVACRRRGEFMRIEIWDTGRGIPAAEIDAIFQEYYQLGNPERDRTKGLGLGLAIVRRLVSLLGYDLQVRSRLHKGSVFAISVPMARTAPRPDDDVMTIDRPAGALRDRLIVVVDDELEILSGMSTILRHWGFKVVVAASAADAIAQLVDHTLVPDLIIADFRLRASESGIDAIEMLRAEYNSPIAAMLISGDTAPERLMEAHRSGLLLLHKPVANSRLRAAITNLLLSGQKRRPNANGS